MSNASAHVCTVPAEDKVVNGRNQEVLVNRTKVVRYKCTLTEIGGDPHVQPIADVINIRIGYIFAINGEQLRRFQSNFIQMIDEQINLSWYIDSATSFGTARLLIITVRAILLHKIKEIYSIKMLKIS